MAIHLYFNSEFFDINATEFFFWKSEHPNIVWFILFLNLKLKYLIGKFGVRK